MSGTLTIRGFTDQLGLRTVRYTEGSIVCGRCDRRWDAKKGEHTKRAEFARSFRGMDWRYTKRYGWVCPRCAKKTANEQRRRKKLLRR